jgi:hypothetical protein
LPPLSPALPAFSRSIPTPLFPCPPLSAIRQTFATRCRHLPTRGGATSQRRTKSGSQRGWLRLKRLLWRPALGLHHHRLPAALLLRLPWPATCGLVLRRSMIPAFGYCEGLQSRSLFL